MAGITRKSASILVSISVLLTSVAQLLFRYAMQHDDSMSGFGWTFVVAAMGNLSAADFLVLGLGILLYGISLVIWTVALTRYPVSVAYPMLSISYILVYVTATHLTALNETASLSRGFGVVVIVIGVSLLAQEKSDESS